MHHGHQIGYLLLLLCYFVSNEAFQSAGMRCQRFMRRAQSPGLKKPETTARFGEMDGFDVSSKPEKATKELVEATNEPIAEGLVEPAENKVETMKVRETETPPGSISSSMKDKLKQELQAQGAYSNKKSANPILIIGAIVAVAVIVGGQGFFY